MGAQRAEDGRMSRDIVCTMSCDFTVGPSGRILNHDVRHLVARLLDRLTD
jgi:hypothetical protein